MQTWKLAYTIEDGIYEYGDYLLHQAEAMDKAAAVAAVAAWWYGDGDPAEEAAFQQEFLQKGYAALPGDDRTLTGLGWERYSPIIVTVGVGWCRA